MLTQKGWLPSAHASSQLTLTHTYPSYYHVTKLLEAVRSCSQEQLAVGDRISIKRPPSASTSFTSTMNPDIKITLCILEYILQSEIYISSRYVHVEGVAKYSLGRQLEHLVRIRSKLEPHIQELLDSVPATKKKLNPAAKSEMKRKVAGARQRPPTKQNTLGSRQRALMKAIADALASDKAEAYGYICGCYFLHGHKIFQRRKKSTGRKRCAYHGKLFARDSAVPAIPAEAKQRQQEQQHAYTSDSLIPGAGYGVLANVVHRKDDEITSYAYSAIVSNAV